MATGSEPPNVVASIPPVHSLVAKVTEGVTVAHLIVPPGASPHGFALRPSDAVALADADLVVWIGPELESFLANDLDDLAPHARSLALLHDAGLETLPIRSGGAWPADHDAAGDGDDAAGGADPHVWLDPVNAVAMVTAIADALGAIDPDHAAAYSANAASAEADLRALDQRVRAALEPVRGRPFVVFHDAYQYLERRYGLNGVGALAIHPELSPSARDMVELRARLRALGQVCVFREPQFSDANVASVVEGTDAVIGTLDPVGAFAPGVALFDRLVEGIGAAFVDCLARLPAS
ncbi:MAG: zinc ABC transporter substrate-binding protein [Alphaproteobacteria bacterium]